MSKPDLRSVFDNHQRLGSDKWTSYFKAYDKHFSHFRDEPISLLEIGVQNGGSLEIWGKYFPQAERLIGCDIEEKCGDLTFEDPRIKVFIGDANTVVTAEKIFADTPEFDLIIDDGSHLVEDVLRSFAIYFPRVKEGGVYVVEDLHTSYWKPWGGGTDITLSSMGFLKLLADLTNQAFWHNKNAQFNLLKPFADRYGVALDANEMIIEEISFSDSVCIIRKGKREFDNRRHLTGTIFSVVDQSSSVALSGTRELVEKVFDENILADATEMQREFIELLPKAAGLKSEGIKLREQLTSSWVENSRLKENLEKSNQELRDELERCRQENENIRKSLSWRITSPLRKLQGRRAGRG